MSREESSQAHAVCPKQGTEYAWGPSDVKLGREKVGDSYLSECRDAVVSNQVLVIVSDESSGGEEKQARAADKMICLQNSSMDDPNKRVSGLESKFSAFF